VHVTSQPSQIAGEVIPRTETMNGQSVVALGLEENGKTVTVTSGKYMLLRFDSTSGAVGFEFTPLESLRLPLAPCIYRKVRSDYCTRSIQERLRSLSSPSLVLMLQAEVEIRAVFLKQTGLATRLLSGAHSQKSRDSGGCQSCQETLVLPHPVGLVLTDLIMEA
jgi:hypothetical protein